MTELWEILLPPRAGFSGDYVGSVYVPQGATTMDVITAGVRRFGADALAYRCTAGLGGADAPWTFIEGDDLP